MPTGTTQSCAPYEVRSENAVMLLMLVEDFSAETEWRKCTGGSRVFQAIQPLIGSLRRLFTATRHPVFSSWKRFVPFFIPKNTRGWDFFTSIRNEPLFNLEFMLVKLTAEAALEQITIHLRADLFV
jgi:hypothetical protein